MFASFQIFLRDSLTMAELLLDSDIRFWVFMPIVVITFFVGMLRHYISIITAGEKPVDKQQLADR